VPRLIYRAAAARAQFGLDANGACIVCGKMHVSHFLLFPGIICPGVAEGHATPVFQYAWCVRREPLSVHERSGAR
jgi:hypothetical protein